MKTLEEIFDGILDMKSPLRWVCVFLFIFFVAAFLFLIVGSPLMLFGLNASVWIASAIGCGVGTALVNTVVGMIVLGLHE